MGVGLGISQTKFFIFRFYEWQVSDGEKQPYYIQLKDSTKPHHQNFDDDLDVSKKNGKQLLTMAGLFDKQYSSEVCNPAQIS